jgi:hypothetical protein
MGNIVEVFSQHQNQNSATGKTSPPMFAISQIRGPKLRFVECVLVDEIYPKEKGLRGVKYTKKYTLD